MNLGFVDVFDIDREIILYLDYRSIVNIIQLNNYLKNITISSLSNIINKFTTSDLILFIKFMQSDREYDIIKNIINMVVKNRSVTLDSIIKIIDYDTTLNIILTDKALSVIIEKHFSTIVGLNDKFDACELFALELLKHHQTKYVEKILYHQQKGLMFKNNINKNIYYRVGAKLMDYTLFNCRDFNDIKIKSMWNDYFLLCPANESGDSFSTLLNNHVFTTNNPINNYPTIYIIIESLLSITGLSHKISNFIEIMRIKCGYISRYVKDAPVSFLLSLDKINNYKSYTYVDNSYCLY